MKKREIVGAGLIVMPFIGLPLTLSAYAMANFIITQTAYSQGQRIDELAQSEIVPQMVNIVLGFAGIFFLLSFFIAIPIGIYLIAVPSKPKAK
jgi:hypothetical protein